MEDEESHMTKTGRVEVGVTPSERSGGQSTRVKKGQALSKREKPIKDLADLKIDLD